MLELCSKTPDHHGEILQLLPGAAVHFQAGIHWVHDDFPGADLLLLSFYDDLFKAGLPDAPGRVVDDTREGILVLIVDRQPEIGQQILDLLALVKGYAPIDTVRYIQPPQ